MIVGLGTDIIEIDRIRDLIDDHGQRILDRLFTQEEQLYCESKIDRYQHYAVRFAGKEAFLKALGTGLTNDMKWKEMGFTHDEYHRPRLICTGEIERRCNILNINNIHVSFSHSKKYALAVVVCED